MDEETRMFLCSILPIPSRLGRFLCVSVHSWLTALAKIGLVLATPVFVFECLWFLSTEHYFDPQVAFANEGVPLGLLKVSVGPCVFLASLILVESAREARIWIRVRRIIHAAWPPSLKEWLFLFPQACERCGSRDFELFQSYYHHPSSVTRDTSSHPTDHVVCVRCSPKNEFQEYFNVSGGYGDGPVRKHVRHVRVCSPHFNEKISERFPDFPFAPHLKPEATEATNPLPSEPLPPARPRAGTGGVTGEISKPQAAPVQSQWGAADRVGDHGEIKFISGA